MVLDDGAREPETVLDAFASHSHLFPGAAIRVALGAGHSGDLNGPVGVNLAFSDGVRVQAEVLVEEGGAGRALDVPEHTTAAGRRIPPKTWSITVAQDGPALVLKVGRRIS